MLIDETNLYAKVGQSESDFTGETLSDENSQKVQIIKELLNSFLKTHVVPESSYGDLFDKYYDKPLSELIILNEMYK